MKTSKGLVEYARAQLGRPYWYGTFGNTATADLLQMKTGQYPAHYQRARMERYKSEIGERVHDCVGLIKGYLWSETPESKPVYNSAQDVSANGMLLKCKERGRIYSLPFQRMLSVVSFQQWHHSDFCFHHHFSFSDSHLFVTKLMDVLLVIDAPASQLFFTEAAGVVSSACLQRYFRHSQTVCLCFPHRNGN